MYGRRVDIRIYAYIYNPFIKLVKHYWLLSKKCTPNKTDKLIFVVYKMKKVYFQCGMLEHARGNLCETIV